MYHEQTTASIARQRRHLVAGALVTLVLAALLGIALSVGHANAHEQGAVTIRSSILRAAQQCCATEGSYPSSIEYLENHYGLTVNHHDYVISYESFAGNVAPSVVVVPR